MQTLHIKPTIIDGIIIGDAPTLDTLSHYLSYFQKHNVTHVVRLCESTYPDHILRDVGITVHDLNFPDGAFPPTEIISKWLVLVKTVRESKQVIYVHCVAGLGRAPTLVAINLIEGGMDPIEAINYVRQRRRGAFNANQMHFLERYRTRPRKSCVIL